MIHKLLIMLDFLISKLRPLLSITACTHFMLSIFVIPNALAETTAVSINKPVAHIAGPNCWNQALISAGLTEIYRFTSADEFTYLINKNCSQISTPITGSLGRMKDLSADVHAFIWISETEVFAKNSMGAFESPSLMPFSEMLNTYLFDEECLKNTNNLQACRRDISYYACESLNPTTLKQQTTLRPLELSLNDLIYGTDTMTRPRMNCTSEPQVQRFKKLQNFYALLIEFKYKKIEDAEYLKTWLKSAELQINEIESSSYFENCQDKDYINNFKIFKKIKSSLKMKETINSMDLK